MRYIYVLLTVLILSSACNAQSSPNTPPIAQPTPPPTTIQPTTSHSDEATQIERDAYKQVVEAHQKTLNTITWAIGIIGTLVLALITYALFKDKKEYENAVKGAEKACEKAEQWEEKARNICDEIETLGKAKLVEMGKTIEQKTQTVLDTIDKKAEAKLKNIGEKTQKSTQEIDAKAKKQMRITELWSDALRLYNEGKYEEASNKYAELIEIRPYAYDHWAYSGWGAVLIARAKLKIGTPEYESLLKQAEEKCLKAESLKTGESAYNLACVYALRGNEEECKKWLLVGQEAGTLSTKDEAMKDDDLATVRNKLWFKEIRWKGER